MRYRNFLDNQSGHVIQMVAEEGWAVGYEGQESDAFLVSEGRGQYLYVTVHVHVHALSTDCL